ncbi:insecticidal delta-endotoxin Cry8Ea1 family protein [Photobacterium angustum]|uniref:insecticidal delta-endotoxin Cry8Ea1 family protein n=1 Tax=Photobacterium angustum TaxID=661 RepID=UPI00215926EF|nr:insecticidal delta-endotoxin Cry8Ea1 family protein [Photobacterium angustum]
MNDRRLALKKLSALVAMSLLSGNSIARSLGGNNELSSDKGYTINYPDFSGSDVIEIFKNSLGFALNFIPEVGGVVSFLVRLLWPSPKEDVWGKIKDKVEELIDEKLDEEVFSRLSTVVAGMNLSLKNYLKFVKGGSPEEIASLIIAINNDFIREGPEFQQKGYEYVLFPLYGVFASLHMTFLRDVLLHHKDILSQNTYDLLKSEMKNYKKQYSDYFKLMVKNQRDKLEKNSPPVGQHRTDTYNYFFASNAIAVKYCDDFIEMFRQMDVDLNPAPFKLDSTKFPDIYSPAYGTADDWDQECNEATNGGSGVIGGVYREPTLSFTSLYLDYFDGRPVNLDVYYPDGKGPINNDGHRVNKTDIIAYPASGVETKNVTIDSIEGEKFPISYAIIKSQSLPSHLTLYDINDKAYELWDSYEAQFQHEHKVAFSPRRLSTMTAWTHSAYFRQAIGCLILGFTWIPPKNKNEEFLQQHYISSIEEPDLDVLSEIHQLDAYSCITSEHEAARDEFWAYATDDDRGDGRGGSVDALPLVGLAGAALLKETLKK